MPWITPEIVELAQARITALGLRPTFGEHVLERGEDDSASIESRVADLHAAFRDPGVRLVLTAIGGYNSNQLLDSLDWKLIRSNPKHLCGFSDITALQNALLARADLASWYGPHFIDFGMRKGGEFTFAEFHRALFSGAAHPLRQPEAWSDDVWARDQEQRTFHTDTAWRVVRQGETEGRLVGGNLSTLCLLQGTIYMPSLDGAVLLVEDDEESHAARFDRDLCSLIQQPGFGGVRGLLVGRPPRASGISSAVMDRILDKPALRRLPVVADLPFGHTSPRSTIPIGGRVHIQALETARITFLGP